ncbi:hypothetical protein VSR01_16095 [Actinacidiphila sp. DG2A-62]|uniref:hypothetical protein n=1 Tax=Actinacidiphila sp. DG2A-62 TaxID=3108821 RepID=UPI002DBAF700|nr:hypothetical protein [Actinacidiphila sp. DG2A-62]MEC3994966.1 hypothetical protein [Actinacidiphila sp. DG2A-62]
MADLHDDVVRAQRAVDGAWACVEAYRRRVTERRRRESQPSSDGHPASLRPWTHREDRAYERLHARVVTAASERAAAMRQHGVTSTWESERELRAAAREPAA